MGANYKTGRVVFDNVSSTNAGAESLPAIIKNADKAGIMVSNTGANSVDIKIQVAAHPGREGGINSLDDINTDTNWFEYNIVDETGARVPLNLAVPAATTFAVDLSVFAFDAIRLIADSSVDDSHSAIDAQVIWGQ